MKKISKPMSRIISMLLALVMVFGMFPVSAFAADAVSVHVKTYKDENQTPPVTSEATANLVTGQKLIISVENGSSNDRTYAIATTSDNGGSLEDIPEMTLNVPGTRNKKDESEFTRSFEVTAENPGTVVIALSNGEHNSTYKAKVTVNITASEPAPSEPEPEPSESEPEPSESEPEPEPSESQPDQGGDETDETVTKLEAGKHYVIVSAKDNERYAMVAETASKNGDYEGLVRTAVEVSGDKVTSSVTAKMIWTASDAGDGRFYLKNGDKYLDGTFTNNPKVRRVSLVTSAPVSWKFEENETSSGSEPNKTYGPYDALSFVDGSGTTRYLSPNQGIFTASSSIEHGEIELYEVELPEVASITLDKAEASLVVDETVTLIVTVEPTNATNNAVTWTSSNETVATVIDGTVTAVGAGEATITATAGGMSATCTVTVTAKDEGVTGTSAIHLAFSSDAHNGGTSYKLNSTSAERLEDWLENVSKEIDDTFDTMAFAGDTGSANLNGTTYWDKVEEVMDVVSESNYVDATEGFFVNGNHEWSNGSYDDYKDDNDTAKRIRNIGDMIETTDYVIYGFGASGSSEKNNGFVSSHIKTLDSELGKIYKATPQKPVFVVSHFPIHRTSARTTSGDTNLLTVLNKYPNVIFLWGHNHTNAPSTENNYDDFFTANETLDGHSNTPIKFTYAAAGCMSDSEYSSGSGAVDGKGLVAKVAGNVVTLTYYTEKGVEVASETVTIPAGSTTPDGGEDDTTVEPATLDITTSWSGGGATAEKEIEVGQELTINMKNGSSSSKTYTVSVGDSSVVELTSADSVTLSGSQTAQIKVKGLKPGETEIVASSSGSYAYKATVNVTVVAGDDETPETPETPETSETVELISSEKVTSLTKGKYVIVVEDTQDGKDKALTTTKHEGYENNSLYEYSGYVGANVTIENKKISDKSVPANVIWNIEPVSGSSSSYYIKDANGKYLSVTITEKNENNGTQYICVLTLADTLENAKWTLESKSNGVRLKSQTNKNDRQNSTYYLTFDDTVNNIPTGQGSDDLFGVRTDSNADIISFFQVELKEVEPEQHQHTYGNVVFTWSEDGTSATASITCTDTTCTAADRVLSGTATVTGDTVGSDCQHNTVTKTAIITLNGTEYTEPKDVTVAYGNHSYEKHDEVPATCAAAGHKAYWSCQTAGCGKHFEDDADKTEITTTTLDAWKTGAGKLEKAAHTYGNAVVTLNEGKTTATVTVTCSGCTEGTDGHAKSKNDLAVEKTENPGDCQTDATTVYTVAAGEFEGVSYEKFEVTVPGDKGNHNLTKHDEVPATHTPDELKNGMEAYYQCSVCQAYFDAEKNATSAEALVIVAAHSYSDQLSYNESEHWYECSCHAKTAVEAHASNAPATETAAELCAKCGYEMNPIQGHTHEWGETTYDFAVNGSSCTAQRVCTKNNTHVENATATITSEVKTDATCEAKGTTTYTATFTETWAKIQTLDVEDIAAKDHAWTVTYNFATDGSGCTATHVCGNDAAHNETATATITSEVKTGATCEAKGTTTYTANFTETWAKTQTLDVQDIPVSEEHDYQNGICSVCGAADPDYKPADTEETFTLVENVTTGKYVVVAVKNNNRYGMTGTYVDSNSANGYNGMKAASVTVADGKITSDVSADMIWQVTVTGGKIVLKNVSQDKFLNAVYETSGSSATNRNVYLDANSVTWAQDSDKALFTENTATKGYLALDNDAKVFSMRGAGAASNKSTIEFYQVGNHKHDAEHVQKADATCTETGMEEYWFCEGCGTYFADADCKEETTADALIIDKIAHAYGNKVGKVDAIHNANELKNGMAAHYQCSVCKAYFDADKHATTAEALVITAAHSYSNELSFNESKHWYACECGAKKDEANHNFSAGKCTDCQATDPNYVPEDNEKDFTLVENVTTGKYVVVAVKNNNRYGMTGTYVDSNKADGYNGMKAASVTVANGKITSDVSADMIWQVTVTDGKIILKNVSQDKFLNAVYETSGSSATNRKVYLDANSVTWAQDSDKALFTENTATKGYLALDNDATVFSMRGAGAASNKSTIEFYQVGAGAVVEPEVTVKSIAVTTNPTKMTYTAGENFDPAGMVVTATYSDGTTAAVTGYTLSGDKNLAADQKEITITFEGQTTKLTVTVNANQPVVPGSGSNIGFTSDMHQNTTNLTTWLKNIQSKVDPNLEYMAFGGDYMWNNGITYFREAVSIVNDLVGKDKGIYTTGNHEYDSSSTVDQMEGTTGFLVTGKPSNETAPNYEIYLMGAEGNGSGTYGTFTATARGELERYLKTAPKDQPIFIVAHWPLHYNNDRTTTGASEMIELLNQYPNTILLWGHNHSMGTDDQYGQIKTAGEEIIITSSNTKKTINFTYANAGGMNDGGKKGSWGNESYNIHGMVANVSASGDQVTLKYYDLNGNLVGDSATIRIAEAAEHVHKPEHKDKVDSTCTETGMKEHYYCTCGKYFSDAEGKSEVNAATLVIAKKSHQYVDITYDWDDDYSKCTASGTCSVGNHEDTAIATKIEAFVVKNPTCEESGTTNHVASFTGDNSWATTDTKVETVDATGHNYGTADYAWSNDNSTCTATRTCRNNSDHVERVTENSTVNAAQSKAPTCGEEGETVYVVVFNVTGLVNQTKTVTVNATGNHTYSNEWTTSEAQHWHACTVCGDKSDLGNHVPGAAATETNPQKCNTCDRVLAPATGHVEHNFTVKVEETPATCTTKGTKIMKCNGCNETQSVDLPIVSDAHKWDDGRITTAATCTTKGVKTYTCEHNSSHKKTEEVAIDRNNHTYQNGFCTGCGAEEGSVPEGPIIELDPEVFGDKVEVWVDGIESDILHVGNEYYVQLPNGADATNMVTYSFKNATSPDVHTQYPESMQVWALKKNADGSYAAERIADLNNILVYCGSSIRITGTKGIRMITGINQAKRNKLINEGLAGYKVMEYGTVLALSSNLGEDESLTLDHEHAKSNYAYKRGVADPVFAYSGNLVQYTNVLVGFNDEQCKEDIVMRSYMKLQDADGKEITIYGGPVCRSIGYIAYQNRNTFAAGTDAYKYVWKIIKAAYGTQYDAEYKG